MLSDHIKSGRASPTSAIDFSYAATEIITTKLFPEKSRTQYLNKNQLSNYMVKRAKNGDHLVWAKAESTSDNRVDTSELICKKGVGYAAYALSKNGNLYIHEHISDASNLHGKPCFYHSSFFAAQSGICFGMIAIENGKITYIDNHSGHYRPGSANLEDAVDRLKWAFADDVEIYLQEANEGAAEENHDFDGDFGISSLFG